MGNLNFNSAEVEPNSMDFDPIPAGKYAGQVIESEVKETSKGGEMLKLTIEILDAPYKSRKVWTNLNIVNSSEKAQQIALGMLSALCRAVGKVGIVSDSSQLHNKPFIVAVGIEPGTVEYPTPKNVVRGFYPAEKFSNSKPGTPSKEGARAKGRKNVKEAIEQFEERGSDDTPDEELPDFLK